MDRLAIAMANPMASCPERLAVSQLIFIFGGLHHYNIFIPDMSAPTLKDSRHFVGISKHALHEGEAIDVHCLTGHGRTGKQTLLPV